MENVFDALIHGNVHSSYLLYSYNPSICIRHIVRSGGVSDVNGGRVFASVCLLIINSTNSLSYANR